MYIDECTTPLWANSWSNDLRGRDFPEKMAARNRENPTGAQTRQFPTTKCMFYAYIQLLSVIWIPSPYEFRSSPMKRYIIHNFWLGREELISKCSDHVDSHVKLHLPIQLDSLQNVYTGILSSLLQYISHENVQFPHTVL